MMSESAVWQFLAGARGAAGRGTGEQPRPRRYKRAEAPEQGGGGGVGHRSRGRRGARRGIERDHRSRVPTDALHLHLESASLSAVHRRDGSPVIQGSNSRAADAQCAVRRRCAL